jgi:hypothetical protein
MKIIIQERLSLIGSDHLQKITEIPFKVLDA